MTEQEYRAKVQRFADLVQSEQRARLEFEHEAWRNGTLEPYITQVHYGRKFARVDVGPRVNMSGRYMVDRDGNIYGVKAYGVVHRGHRFGTLDTIEAWDWSGYRGHQRQGARTSLAPLLRVVNGGA